MKSIHDWNVISSQEASEILFFRCVELMLIGQTYNITSDLTIRILTQRLYGDYRQITNTQEYKRADKHVRYFKNTKLGKLLF